MNYKSRFKSIIKCLIILVSLFTIHYSLFTHDALAVCPVCTVAIGAGLGLSRWLGIDDSVSGIWIGGLLMSTSFWTIDWLGKKKFKLFEKLNKNQITTLAILFWYTITLIPLWAAGIIGHPLNTILGVDKIIFGTTLGSIMFLLGVWADKKERKVKGKQLFQYQKVILPVISLVITSLLIYYYGGYLY